MAPFHKRANGKCHEYANFISLRKLGDAEQTLVCPKFILKMIHKVGISCKIKLYYSLDFMISEML